MGWNKLNYLQEMFEKNLKLLFNDKQGYDKIVYMRIFHDFIIVT